MTVPSKDIYTVGQLNREVGQLLTRGLGRIWIAGEVSNLSQPRSGHWYFSLKDADAQVRCAMFKNANRLVRNAPGDGDQVLLRARVGLYEPRGDYQLIAEHMEPAGEGALRLAFERLKRKLSAEGLFDADRKQALPTCPRIIGVVTSATGAALRDILAVLARRCPLVTVRVFPVPVQGDAAAPAIAAAITRANDAQAPLQPDVLIVGRGGGSLEDLWAFNEEVVARAIADSKLPIISAVGHEVDSTIADWVADLRAPTPSAAAEAVVPDLSEMPIVLAQHEKKLAASLGRVITRQRHAHAQLAARLQRAHPQRKLEQAAQRLDDAQRRAIRAMQRVTQSSSARVNGVRARLLQTRPDTASQLERIAALHARQQRALRSQHQSLVAWHARLSHALNAASPLAVVNRGYAILQQSDGQSVRGVDDVSVGDALVARIADGRVEVKATGVRRG